MIISDPHMCIAYVTSVTFILPSTESCHIEIVYRLLLV